MNITGCPFNTGGICRGAAGLEAAEYQVYYLFVSLSTLYLYIYINYSIGFGTVYPTCNIEGIA